MKKIVLPMAALAILLLASCTKDKSTIPETATTPQASTMKASKGGFASVMQGGASRKINSNYDCFDKDGNCAPEDIVITSPHLNNLYRASQAGGAAIKALFSNENTALIYAPDWNKPYFADVKAAILSGKYTFIKAPGSNTYLLGKEGVVSTQNYDYAIPYKL